MLRIIGIAGSPRRRGNSTTLLQQVLQGAQDKGAEGQIIFLNDLTFRGCQACDGCIHTGKCSVEDELTPYYQHLREADVWVLASPIYYDSFSGQAKLFFDRCRCFSMDQGRLDGKRRAAVIVTYEDRPRDDYQEATQRFANYFSWFGDFGKVKMMVESRLGPADAASKRPDLLEKAYDLGQQLVSEMIA
jgi:multimeric flavodoxin WrbA